MISDKSNHRIVSCCSEADEDSCLRRSYFQLEYERTTDLILRHLPLPPGRILDVGGDSGAYACWLSSKGYEVYLIDGMPKHVEQARAASTRQKDHPLAWVGLSDARHLQQQTGFADALLLLGPLYLLAEEADRLRCLREAHRVLKTGGCIWGSAISRFAPLFDAVSHGFFADLTFSGILDHELEQGQRRNTTNNPLYFTDAFLHRPEELRQEFIAAGFRVIEVAGIEGPAWLSSRFDALWKDPGQRERLLTITRKIEHEPSIMGASAHIMVIAQK